MDLQLQQRAQAVFDDIVDLPPADRRELLAQVCGGNVVLKELVEELLRLDESAEQRFADVLETTGLGEETEHG